MRNFMVLLKLLVIGENKAYGVYSICTVKGLIGYVTL